MHRKRKCRPGKGRAWCCVAAAIPLAAAEPAPAPDPHTLVLQWLFLPRKVVRDLLHHRSDARRLLRAVGFDDLEQAGLLSLVRAANRWDPARGVRFSTFAFPHVLNGIRKEILRQLARRPPEEPLATEPAAADAGRPFEELYAGLARLAPADRALLEQRFGLGGRMPRTFRSLARECGRTRECVRKRVARALARLAAELAALR